MSAPPTKPPPPTLGQNIRNAREARGLTQLALAQAIGHKGDGQEDCKSGLGGSSYISRLETGAHPPKLETLYRIAAALDTPVDRLILGPETTKNRKEKK